MICARCGAVVGDRMRHLSWHAMHEDLEGRLAEFEDERDARLFSVPPPRTRSAPESVPPPSG